MYLITPVNISRTISQLMFPALLSVLLDEIAADVLGSTGATHMICFLQGNREAIAWR